MRRGRSRRILLAMTSDARHRRARILLSFDRPVALLARCGRMTADEGETGLLMELTHIGDAPRLLAVTALALRPQFSPMHIRMTRGACR